MVRRHRKKGKTQAAEEKKTRNSLNSIQYLLNMKTCRNSINEQCCCWTKINKIAHTKSWKILFKVKKRRKKKSNANILTTAISHSTYKIGILRTFFMCNQWEEKKQRTNKKYMPFHVPFLWASNNSSEIMSHHNIKQYMSIWNGIWDSSDGNCWSLGISFQEMEGKKERKRWRVKENEGWRRRCLGIRS